MADCSYISKIDKFPHRTSKGICGVLQGLTQNIRRFYFLSLDRSHFSLQPCCWTSHEWEQISQFPAEWFCCPCQQPPENNKNESWLSIAEDFTTQSHKFQWQRNLWQEKDNIHRTGSLQKQMYRVLLFFRPLRTFQTPCFEIVRTFFESSCRNARKWDLELWKHLQTMDTQSALLDQCSFAQEQQASTGNS